jgi:23S rRNA (cytidine1920-2'-O)/16S rRNA (cytidine1409-2'-O)-methyltransferase
LSKSPKTRLDQLLLERGLVESRARGHALILAGRVFSGEQRLDKPGHQVAVDVAVTIREPASRYVSRGGIKLAHGLDHFGLEPEGLVALDLGASTGGFTDVLLRRGARRVYALDVGHGQLDWRLRNHGQVVVLERLNARHLSDEVISEPIDLITCDVSFISLRLALPAALQLARPNAWLMALIKPQFEVGKGQVGKGGVVRSAAVHAQVTADIHRWLVEDQGWPVLGIIESPITGPKGNREFLICARR